MRMRLSRIADTFGLTELSGADKPVIDKTGHFAIEFSPDVPAEAPFQADPNGPTFQEALKEQLGLKFEQQTASLNVIVIDHVEQSSEN
jgi:uncharacterized protein (TIGR03435 family)